MAAATLAFTLLTFGPTWIPAIIDSFIDLGAAAGNGSVCGAPRRSRDRREGVGDEDQARAVDRGMRELMEREALPYTVLPTDVDAVNAFAATLLA